MNDQPEKINPFIVNQHKAQIDLIEYSKKRQWAITNYSALIYVAIFGLAHSLGQSIMKGERVALTLLAILTFGCATWLLIQIQSDAGRYRARLKKKDE
jgi:hypothetical protein